jgi:uncharacterized membrane protein
MSDLFVALYVFLFVSTALLALVYFYRLRQEAKDSLSAKKALDDIIISFNKDLESESKKIRELEEQENKKLSDLEKSASHVESRIQAIETRMDTLQHGMEGLMNKYQEQRVGIEPSTIYHSKDREDRSTNGLISSQRMVAEIPAMPPILLRRESALSPLTETELQILKLLVSEGGKTSPDIKERIGLTREHTARLMKKLYARGYVERRTEKMPYIYQIKKEMESLLNAPSSNT